MCIDNLFTAMATKRSYLQKDEHMQRDQVLLINFCYTQIYKLCRTVSNKWNTYRKKKSININQPWRLKRRIEFNSRVLFVF